MLLERDRTVAYFSMEIALESAMPTYSGGLGALAGDTIRSAADLKVPMVGITLLYRKGYFFQSFDKEGNQIESPAEWNIENFLQPTHQKIVLNLQDRDVYIQAWRYEVLAANGFNIPVYFLDTDLPENSEEDRKLTATLYGGDSRYRLCQEAILGIGGVKMLRKLCYYNINTFHMNEGHASLLTLELLEESAKQEGREEVDQKDIDKVRSMCVFTTHTPVPAGHDQFPLELVKEVLGHREMFEMKNVFCHENTLNMTYLALNLSYYVNGVAKKHGEISRLMFGGHKIDAITNGVYAPFWVSSPFQELFDRYIPNWRDDNFSFRYALSIPTEEVWQAHLEAKKKLLEFIGLKTNIAFDIHAFTIGFARRAAAYKRGDLLFSDIDRLKRLSREFGKIQIVYAGKAHPKDKEGKELIQKIFEAMDELKDDVKVIYLDNYDLNLAKLLTSGSDLWLNTPRAPMEASGTSGMKAALNGVPSLSILDGWWIEGCIENITGWAIGKTHEHETFDQNAETNYLTDEEDAISLLDKLENVILPMYTYERDDFIHVMLNSIALNGSFFNTQRMVQQYVLNAYYRYKPLEEGNPYMC